MTKVDDLITLAHAKEHPTFKERAADVVSEFGGSWTFVIMFISFFGGWIAFNLVMYTFDSYPFILLNLILSCIAVFQAPFILMSQNRAADIDRKRAEEDYKVDLETQLEIQELHSKIDLLLHNWVYPAPSDKE